ncbi:cbb3-type cytochrome oxidase assembly protein CcoS [Marinobacter fonticola]|uniref:cbb3-type cytochrome oxidase assembly protein CcoS n=1 Tax=Marinobacter fonticola TaxID=2603215 RepID=UPI0011E70EEC|nr:cbb3-type cytochrome oxidase assembly protein CcoS [Marinobacter fonticola]
MEIVYLLVPVTLILVALGIAIFSWAVKNGQYDDLEGPAHRILYDDDQDMIPDDAKTEQQVEQSPKRQREQQHQHEHPLSRGKTAVSTDDDGR